MSTRSPPRAAVITSSNLPISSTQTRSLLPSSTQRFDKVKKNAKGGVLITTEEIHTAFQMLDVDKSGQVNLQHLKKRLGVLFPELSAKEYRFLMNNKKELTVNDLKELLCENEITNFDPVAEAFKIFDVNGEGVLNGDRLREAFIAYGFGELADEEFDILTRTADIDGDGIITVDDFRSLIEPAGTINNNNNTTSAGATVRKYNNNYGSNN